MTYLQTTTRFEGYPIFRLVVACHDAYPALRRIPKFGPSVENTGLREGLYSLEVFDLVQRRFDAGQD